MKFAYHTILFGRRIGREDGYLHTVLAQIAEAGFTGVEFAQPLQQIFVAEDQPVPDLPALLRAAADHGLNVIGLAGGSVKERAAAVLSVKDWQGAEPPYLYVDNWNDRYAAYLEQGLRLAIHPHVYMNCDRLAIARKLARRYKELLWMPDTAHLAIVGDSIDKALREWKPSQMPAVHLKDWDPSFGRSYHRYARGFVGLGQGRIRYQRVLQILREIAYDGWVVAEQDYCTGDRSDVIREAARRLGLTLQEPHTVTPLSQNAPCCPPDLAEKLLRAGFEGVDTCYASLARTLCEHFSAKAVKVWTHYPSENYNALLSAYPLDARGQQAESQELVERAAHALDTVEAPPGALAFPVLNRFNRRHVRFVVVMRRDTGFTDEERASLGSIAEVLVRAADLALDEDYSRAVGRVNFAAEISDDLDEFLGRLLTCIQESIDCEGVTIFLTDKLQTRLEPKATTGLAWRDDVPENRHFYRRIDQFSATVAAWTSAHPILSRDGRALPEHAEAAPFKSREAGPGMTPGIDNVLLVPLVNITERDDIAWTGSVAGVLRCRNRRERDGFRRHFSVDDAAILEGICQAAGPHIELLRAEEDRMRAVGRITHELASPVNTLRHTLGSFMRDVGAIQERYGREFRFDYVRDMNAMFDIMNRVIGSAGIYGLANQEIELRVRSAWLMGEVVAPLVGQIRHLLEEKGFRHDAIVYDGFDSIPKLYIDVIQFQQVLFNLISNAIKYAFRNPSQFAVRIQASRTATHYVLSVQDDGPGIIPEMEEGIFEEGVRGPDGLNRLVFGLGIGLWVVRRIVEAHGGRVRVTSFYHPTEISVFLPLSLSDRPPRSLAGQTRVVPERSAS